MMVPIWARTVLAIALAPVAGGLLTGVDRKISARMQGRTGPPLLQPFYDVAKLLTKQAVTVNHVTRYYITIYLCFSIFTTTVFLAGLDILIAIFALTLASVFFVVAGYSSWSPYSLIGAERELLQIMAYEPMILLTAFGFYYVTKSFEVRTVLTLDQPVVLRLPLIFAGLIYVLGFKLRKSPFDLSTSHHGHQEIVKGITTELNAVCLAMVEVAHWYETVFALGLVFMFFAAQKPVYLILAAVVSLLVFIFEILTDNAFARVKWDAALKVSWMVTAVAGLLNLYAVHYWRPF